MSDKTSQEPLASTVSGRWENLFHESHRHYRKAEPFPHIVIDNFLPREVALDCARNFPQANSEKWTNYIHINERKYGLNKREHIPSPIVRVIDELQTADFLQYLGRLTSVPGLIADDQLAGAGLHQTYPGGFLNIHSDFLVHPLRPTLRRRINLIVFLSDDWQETYGGELQFWNKEMTQCITTIKPVFNRCVIFQTDEHSYHGCPDKLRGPEGFSRKTLALYYYTEFAQAPGKLYTHYKPRPGDSRFPIWLDTQAIAIYTWLKRKLKFNDDFISRLLKPKGKNPKRHTRHTNE
jgi:Rps23 Pro-64 3,4-dihydroxylase Tpa1-like proline 4-hydroxylase